MRSLKFRTHFSYFNLPTEFGPRRAGETPAPRLKKTLLLGLVLIHNDARGAPHSVLLDHYPKDVEFAVQAVPLSIVSFQRGVIRKDRHVPKHVRLDILGIENQERRAFRAAQDSQPFLL